MTQEAGGSSPLSHPSLSAVPARKDRAGEHLSRGPGENVKLRSPAEGFPFSEMLGVPVFLGGAPEADKFKNTLVGFDFFYGLV